jgi:hypothetical protein
MMPGGLPVESPKMCAGAPAASKRMAGAGALGGRTSNEGARFAAWARAVSVPLGSRIPIGVVERDGSDRPIDAPFASHECEPARRIVSTPLGRLMISGPVRGARMIGRATPAERGRALVVGPAYTRPGETAPRGDVYS